MILTGIHILYFLYIAYWKIDIHVAKSNTLVFQRQACKDDVCRENSSRVGSSHQTNIECFYYEKSNALHVRHKVCSKHSRPFCPQQQYLLERLCERPSWIFVVGAVAQSTYQRVKSQKRINIHILYIGVILLMFKKSCFCI